MVHDELIEAAFESLEWFEPVSDRNPVDVVSSEYIVDVPGQGRDYWSPDRTPYMIEPLNMLASTLHNFMLFMGPQRTGKSVSLVNGGILWAILERVVDFMVIRSSEYNAETWSMTELARLFESNPRVRRMLRAEASADNRYRKRFSNGSIGLIGWPSSQVLAEKTLGMIVGTDCGKWPKNLNGQGSMIDQAHKRLQTFGPYGIGMFESSPSSVWSDLDWQRPKGSHEMPPTSAGIHEDMCAWYNAGDRRMWYVQCGECKEFYCQDPFIERFAGGGTVCDHCGSVHLEETKYEENLNGIWLPEGVSIKPDRSLSGTPRDTFPSWSLGGGAAAEQTRKEIGDKLAAAAEEMERGSPGRYQIIVNSDIGGPARLQKKKNRTAEALLDRRFEQNGIFIPPGVLFIIIAVDVQLDRFVVQVTGYGINGQRWIIDRFNIAYFYPFEGDTETKEDIDPAGRLEHWQALDKLIEKPYTIGENGSQFMRPMATVCDSGGAAGVTGNAYAYWRAMRLDDKRRHMINKFRLVKGEARPKSVPVSQTFPTSKTGRKAITHGDVPLLSINTTYFKDVLSADLSRESPGPGYCNFPSWLGPWWFDELTREERGPKGWSSPKKNEAWDLMVYADAAAAWGPMYLVKDNPKGIWSIDWKKPPAWALPADTNPLVTAANEAAAPVRKKRRYG